MKLAEWRRQQLEKYGITRFFYFAVRENLNSILMHGILPKNELTHRNISSSSFADTEVQSLRDAKSVQLSDYTIRNVHDLVPVYLTARTPTLYARRNLQHKVFFSIIDPYLLLSDDAVEFAFTDGNAASRETSFYRNLQKLGQMPWDVLKATSWHDLPDGKRKRNAEFLIYPKIPLGAVVQFAVLNNQMQTEIHYALQELHIQIPVTVDPDCFFC